MITDHIHHIYEKTDHAERCRELCKYRSECSVIAGMGFVPMALLFVHLKSPLCPQKQSLPVAAVVPQEKRKTSLLGRGAAVVPSHQDTQKD